MHDPRHMHPRASSAPSAEAGRWLLPLALLCVLDLRAQQVNPQQSTQPQSTPRPSTPQEPQQPVNRLSKESSPYLKLHQNNPVDWHAWGPEALALAKELDKPIFLSIGYSACHWCHVMAKESFSDENIAKLMNESFVCIKVDREERPDIDEIYMGALQAMGKQGGWPLSAWLTPDGKPFFGGTYFPPEDSQNRPGFRRVCISLAKAWKEQRDEVLGGAKEVSDYLERNLAPKLVAGEPTAEMMAKVLMQSASRFDGGDPKFAGFGQAPRFAPKFPNASELRALLRVPNGDGVDMAVAILRAMANGGVHDQLGGGFHRYSTDRRWLVPHFEKMLYDNAMLVVAYLEAHGMRPNEGFDEVARTTLDYMLRELQSQAGGFWSTQDAQSEGVEGKFFVWQKAEVDALLGDDAEFACAQLGISKAGNWEHKNVLWRQKPLPADASALARLQKAKAKLLAARDQRIKPATDDKVLAAWNGLALEALCAGYRSLGDARYLQAAQKCAGFLVDNLVENGRTKRSFQGNKARYQGYLDDHASLANGLLSLFEVDANARWLSAARDLMQQVAVQFRADDGAFYFTAKDHEQLLARTKRATEGATPPGNALAASAFLRAGLLLGDEQLYGYGVHVLRAYHELLSQSPASSPSLMLALHFYVSKPVEIVVVGAAEDKRTQSLLRTAWSRVAKPGVVAHLTESNRTALEALSSVFRGKALVDGSPAAYVCERGVCKAPILDAAKLAAALEAK